jgi:broad specificity phosphatase PhoE
MNCRIALILGEAYLILRISSFQPGGGWRRIASSGKKAQQQSGSRSKSVLSISPKRRAVENDNNRGDANRPIGSSLDRRSFCVQGTVPFALALAGSIQPGAAQARGLVQFPLSKPLSNTYHFMRVGTTLLEEDDIWSTNPLFLTNSEDSLSPRGEAQVLQVCQQIIDSPRGRPTVLKYSLAAACIDTANVIARDLKIGGDRLIPEFVFMDPRGIGAWDMSRKTETYPAVWAMDAAEAGNDGLGGRPPPNTDGTAHETLGDQYIRLRQLLSSLETQYSGDTILLIFPDGTGPALLSCMMAGIPYARTHELEFRPGEIRLDVTPASIQDTLRQKEDDATLYMETISKGNIKLKELRNSDNIVSRKDQLTNQEQRNLEMALVKKQQERLITEDREKQDRNARQKQIVANDRSDNSNSAETGISIPTLGLAVGGVAGIGGVVLSNISPRETAENVIGAMNATTGDNSWGSKMTNTTDTLEVNSTMNLFDIKKPVDLFGNLANATSRTTQMNASLSSRLPNVSNFNSSRSDAYSGMSDSDKSDEDDLYSQPKVPAYVEPDGGEGWLASLQQIIQEGEDLVQADRNTSKSETSSSPSQEVTLVEEGAQDWVQQLMEANSNEKGSIDSQSALEGEKSKSARVNGDSES